MSILRHLASPVSDGLPRNAFSQDSTRTPMPSICCGLDATDWRQQQQDHEPAEGEDQRQRVLAGAQQERAAQAEQRQPDHLQHARTSPTATTPPPAKRPTAAAGDRRTSPRAPDRPAASSQCVAGVERGLRAPLLDRARRPTRSRVRWIWAKLCIEPSAASAAAASTHHQLAVSRLCQALASWSHTSDDLDGQHGRPRRR